MVVTIRNVFVVIRGLEEPDYYVLLGNHRDAWTYGAVDPNSGTAALLDNARRYALLMRLGWYPQRTIFLCSWDVEEFGMIGSTEWVEQNLVNLGSKAVAYLNVDCAVQGPGFFVGAIPQLDNLILEITKKVKDPDSEGATVYEKWVASNTGINIQKLAGVGSDFAPFVQHAGFPSVDIYYGRDFPVYHTAFESYSWMTNYGDPLFQRHVAVAGIWGLLALHLADWLSKTKMKNKNLFIFNQNSFDFDHGPILTIPTAFNPNSSKTKAAQKSPSTKVFKQMQKLKG